MIYALEHPVRGIVNVDAALDTDDFSAHIRALESQLRNGGVPALWDELFPTLHAERSGPVGEAMLRATSRPRPDVMLGYWSPLFAGEEVARNMIAAAIASLRAERTPYTLVFGEEPDASTLRWMGEHFPEANVTALPGSGHFPHVAHPEAFARILAGLESRRPECLNA
jgi:pimeloyl-ACP methyl ester carboxylesterase